MKRLTTYLIESHHTLNEKILDDFFSQIVAFSKKYNLDSEPCTQLLISAWCGEDCYNDVKKQLDTNITTFIEKNADEFEQDFMTDETYEYLYDMKFDKYDYDVIYEYYLDWKGNE